MAAARLRRALIDRWLASADWPLKSSARACSWSALRWAASAWVELVIREGRNRQVRRMTAAVGLPTLRLVRARIGPWSLGELLPGQWQEVEVPAQPINAPAPPAAKR